MAQRKGTGQKSQTSARRRLHRAWAMVAGVALLAMLTVGCSVTTTAPPKAAPAPSASPAAAPAPSAPASAAEAGAGYHTITEPALTVEVPADWADQGDDTYSGNGVEGPAITVSTDDEAFLQGFEAPGLILTASKDLAGDPDQVLDELAGSGNGCTKVGRMDYDDSIYTGRYETYEDCGPTGTELYLVAARPQNQSYGVLVLMQDAPATAERSFRHIAETFRVVDESKL